MKTIATALSALQPVSQPGLVARLRDFITLMKPRVMALAVFTALVGLASAPRQLDPLHAFAAVLAIAAGAGAAGVLNMWYDADIDAIMTRTAMRPIPRGKVSRVEALVLGLALAGFAIGLLAIAANLLAAALLGGAILVYIGVYTAWLKRSTPQNIVIGGAAGAMPVLVGWAAVTNSLAWAPLVLFGVIFLWTPPHFWALAVKYKDDYEAAHVPMMPVVATFRRTATEIIAYTVAMVALTLVLAPVAHLGAVYVVSAAVLGFGFVVMAVRLWIQATPKASMQLFSYSITYLTLLFVMMAVDVFVHH